MTDTRLSLNLSTILIRLGLVLHNVHQVHPRQSSDTFPNLRNQGRVLFLVFVDPDDRITYLQVSYHDASTFCGFVAASGERSTDTRSSYHVVLAPPSPLRSASHTSLSLRRVSGDQHVERFSAPVDVVPVDVDLPASHFDVLLLLHETEAANGRSKSQR